jgi:tetratricopeptide (TPR) repeat protein
MLVNAAGTAHFVRHNDRAEGFLLRAHSIAVGRAPDGWAARRILANLGELHFEEQRFDDARREYSAALAAALTRDPDDPLVEACRLALGSIALARGDVLEARQRLQAIVVEREALVGVDHPSLAFPLFVLAEAQWRASDYDVARHNAVRAVSILDAQGEGDPVRRRMARTLLAEILLDSGSAQEALAVLEVVEAEAGAGGHAPSERTEFALARIERALGRNTAAQQRAGRVLAALDEDDTGLRREVEQWLAKTPPQRQPGRRAAGSL